MTRRDRSGDDRPNGGETRGAAGTTDRRFRAIARNDLDLISEVDAQGHVYYASSNHATLIPGAFDATGSESLLEMVAPEQRDEVVREFARVFSDHEGVRVTFRVRAEGEPRWFEISASPFVAEDGTTHAILVSRDVSAAKQADERLRASRERFRLISENAYDMIAEYDAASGRLLYTNPRARKVLGYGAEAARFSPQSLVHPEDRARVATAFAPIIAGHGHHTSITYRVSRADGRWCWLDANLRAVEEVAEEGRRLLVIARDVTARVEAEQQLRESEARYRELVEGAPVGILVIHDGSIVFSNQPGAEICGAESSERLEGRKVVDLVFRNEAQRAGQRMADAPDGSVEGHTTDIRIRGLDGRVRNVAGTGSVISWRGAPAYQAVIRDVTEGRRIEGERQLLELQLQEARKLESLGSLAGGIAHDFNNLLAVVLANLTFAQRELPETGEVGEALGDAVEAAKSAARLTAQLLAYAGRRSPDVRAVDLSRLVEETSALLGAAVSSRVQLELDLAREPVAVRADSVQLEQVLMNLVINASEAIGDRPGTITVSTCRAHVDAEALRACIGGEELPPGDYVTLEVSDTGAGMDERTRRRIFEPFFTTKPAGHGLGLSAVLGLVRGHRGAISLETSRERGTCVGVYLPASGEAELGEEKVAPRRRFPGAPR